MAEAKKRALAKTEVSGVTVRTFKDGDHGAIFELELENGVFLRLTANRYGYVALDHALGKAGELEDERRILTGGLTLKKRAFDVYSTSGYANHYKGKPIASPSLAPVADAKEPSSAKASSRGEEVTTPSSDATTDASTSSASSSSAGESVTPSETFVGAAVMRSGGETGKVTGYGKDVVGTHLNIEWADKGFESMYADDLKGAEVVTLPPVEASAAPAAGAKSSKKAGAKKPAKRGTKRTSTTASASAKPRKKPTKVALAYDELDSIIADIAGGA